jgi:hypothetical protein
MPAVAAAQGARILVFLSGLVLISPVHANAQSPLFPPGSVVEGKTISDWAGEWINWWLGAPPGQQPMHDQDGSLVNINQNAPVFFVPSSFSIPFGDPTQKSFTVPHNKPILLPAASNAWFQFPEDPPQPFGMQLIDQEIDTTSQLWFTVDGTEVPQSELFMHRIRETFTAEVAAGSSATQDFNFPPASYPESYVGGYFFMLRPLPVGEHTVHFGGIFTPSVIGFGADVLARITVVPGAGSTWSPNGNGNWSQSDNWTGGVPNAPGDEATFRGTTAAAITLDVPITVGLIELDNPAGLTIAGSNALTLDATSGDAEIEVVSGSHTISAPVNLAENTLITVTPTSGNLAITGPVNGASTTLTKNGAGTLTLNQLRAAGVSLNSGKIVVAQDSTPDTLLLGTLSIAGGTMPTATFDLSNNALVIDYSGVTPVATVRQQILAGRGGAGLGKTWNGQGITSSAAAAAAANDPESRSVGYAENSSLPLGPYTNFRGQPVDDTSLLIAFTRTGDANLDGVVNDDDVTIVGATYSPGVPQPHWGLGDFDYNGFVDDDDVTLLGVFYDPTATPIAVPASTLGNNVTAVPEPSTFGLLATMSVVALFVIRYRRLTTAGESLTTGLHGARIL